MSQWEYYIILQNIMLFPLWHQWVRYQQVPYLKMATSVLQATGTCFSLLDLRETMIVLSCMKLQNDRARLDDYSGRIMCNTMLIQLQNKTSNILSEIRYQRLSETVPEKCDLQRRTVPVQWSLNICTFLTFFHVLGDEICFNMKEISQL